MELEAIWALLPCGLIGEDASWSLRVGDTFEGGLSIDAAVRADARSTDGVELVDPRRRLYRATGVARSSAYTWILEVGDLRLVTYQDPPGPSAGRRYTLAGRILVAQDYEWDLATDPQQGGAPHDGRRRWRVLDIRIGERSVDHVARWPMVDHWLALTPVD